MSVKIPIPCKEQLIKEYSKYGSSISTLARYYNTSRPTIRSWLKFYEIEIKPHNIVSNETNNMRRNNIPEKKIIINLYQDMTLKELQKYFKVGQDTIYQWLEFYDIPIRSLSESTVKGKQKQYADILFDKEFLEQKYKELDNNLMVLCENLNVSYSHIKKLFNLYGIERVIPWRSKGEIELFEKVKNIDNSLSWDNNNKSLINPFELDMVCHEKKIAIEYCGLYWHSETYGNKTRNYHFDKWKRCKDIGYDLITVFESDNIDKIIFLLKKKLGKTKKINARKCNIVKISSSEAKKFHDLHHLHNSVGGSLNYGLYYNDNLVMAISFHKSRFNKKYEWECSRLTSHSDYTVIGGVSKLFKNIFKKENILSCITYADLRFGEGKCYSFCKFNNINISKPNYWYFNVRDNKKIYSRIKFQKHKLKDLDIYNEDISEYKNMLNNYYDRIWDCGNMIWVYQSEN